MNTNAKTTEHNSPINWLKVIAEAAEAKSAILKQQMEASK